MIKQKHITPLKEGDVAPAINAKDEEGRPISLDDFKGKKVVLYFYPKMILPVVLLSRAI